MWPFSKKKKDWQLLDMPDTGEYSQEVVGESFYQENLEKICGGRTEEGHHKKVKAILYCENDNKHDSNAVRVDIEGMTVGHLPRSDAKEHRKALEDQSMSENPVRCSALIAGGWSRERGDDKGDFGVRLDLGDD